MACVVTDPWEAARSVQSVRRTREREAAGSAAVVLAACARGSGEPDLWGAAKCSFLRSHLHKANPPSGIVGLRKKARTPRCFSSNPAGRRPQAMECVLNEIPRAPVVGPRESSGAGETFTEVHFALNLGLENFSGAGKGHLNPLRRSDWEIIFIVGSNLKNNHVW